MQIELLITLITLGATIVGGIIALIVAIKRGELKKFIIEKMEEAEKLELDGKKKLEYVLTAVNEKYKVMQLVLNVKKFIEYIISISKQINAK